jgi:RNA 3'-terminal phosphate cyclase (ATP)
MLQIDGSHGEGGGQVLRTSLALSMITGTPFRMDNVRAGRTKPGLLRQHLASLRAAAAVCSARVTGDEVGSSAVSFEPGPVRAGEYHFVIGSAGSATLVLQTVLPALLRTEGPSSVRVEGGTHNRAAPCFDFLERAFGPLLVRMGAGLALTLERPGFYPAGGGVLQAQLTPAPLGRLELLHATPVRARRASARVAGIPPSIAMRELEELAQKLDWPRETLRPQVLQAAFGPGNVVVVEIEREDVTEVFSGFGEKGRRAEQVAADVAAEVRAYLNADVPVGPHLADQLVLLLAIGAGGAFRTQAPSGHLRTQVEIIERFLGTRPRLLDEGDGRWRVEVD